MLDGGTVVKRNAECEARATERNARKYLPLHAGHAYASW